MLRTLVAVGTAVAETVVLTPLIVGASYVSEDLTESLSRAWARTLLAGMGVERSVEGLEQLDVRQPYVYVCNHQSHVDPPTCFVSLPGHLRFVAKESLFKVPLFGAALKRAGHIPIDRSDHQSSTARLNENLEALKTRVSIVLFPEGTRSEDGVLGPFKKGAAVLAIQAQVPVVPMAIAGTRYVLPKGVNAIHGGRVRLRVGAPIPTAGMTLDDREALTSRLHDEVARLMVGLEPA
jgi:1-acyl-sn-glycerol-3-phosphate acyltransferase